MTPPVTRRQFVAHAAALGAGVMVLPRHVLGGVGAPSRTLNIGMVGGGGMAASNASALVAGGHRIVALADVDLAYADKVVRDRSRNGQTGEVNPDFVRLGAQYAAATRYTDFRRMLEREKGIDAVVVATPDHIHAAAAKMAMDAGKHVYVQKPLTYSVHEARVLRETAARNPRLVTQMGNQGHSNREAGLINEWVRGGALGPVREVHAWTNRPIWPQGIPAPAPAPTGPSGSPFGNVYTSRTISNDVAAALQASGAGAAPPAGLDWDLYLGPAAAVPYHPIYHPFNWRGWTNFGAGALGDMGAHLIDHPYWALGLTYPERVEATSTPWGGDQDNPASYPLSMLVHYDFPARGAQPPVRLSWYDGGLMPQRPAVLPDDVRLDRGGGVLIVGERGVLLHETYGLNPRIFPESLFREVAPAYVEERARAQRDAEARRAQQAAGAGPPRQLPKAPVITHELNWANAIMNNTPAICPFSYAGPLTETMLLGLVALRSGQGRSIAYDGAAGRVTNAPEADRFLRREYRAGWSL